MRNEMEYGMEHGMEYGMGNVENVIKACCSTLYTFVSKLLIPCLKPFANLLCTLKFIIKNYASVRMRRRHTVVGLCTVCMSVTRISRRLLKTKRW